MGFVIAMLATVANLEDLQELKEMREAGVRTFEEGEEYEAEKRKHNPESGRTGDWPHRQSFQMGIEDSLLSSQVNNLCS